MGLRELNQLRDPGGRLAPRRLVAHAKILEQALPAGRLTLPREQGGGSQRDAPRCGGARLTATPAPWASRLQQLREPRYGRARLSAALALGALP